MPVETDADRATFVAVDDFGRAVTWSRGGVPSTFNAVFTRPSMMAEGLGEIALIDRDASLVCREIDLPAGADEGDGVSIEGEGTAYTAKAIRPDGTGMVIVDLAKVI